MVLAIAPAKKALTLVVDPKPFHLDGTQTRGQTRGHLTANPELIRRETQRASMLLIAPIIEGRCGTGGLGDLELSVNTKPVAVIGVLTRVTLKKPKIDEVGRHVSKI